MLIFAATVAAGIALLLTVRSLRAAALLATMKSEFVSAVTHELRTPLSSIRLASETLVKGRVSSKETTAEYAALLLNEVSRLNRTVDNLRDPDVVEFRMELQEAKSPLLGEGGVAAPSRKWSEGTLLARTGVVRSTTAERIYR